VIGFAVGDDTEAFKSFIEAEEKRYKAAHHGNAELT